MSGSRRNFSAEFKTNLVLQLLKGEKEVNAPKQGVVTQFPF